MDALRGLARGSVAWGAVAAILTVSGVGLSEAVARMAAGSQGSLLVRIPVALATVPFAAMMMVAGAASTHEVLEGRAPSAAGALGTMLRSRATVWRVAIHFYVSATLGLVCCLVPGIAFLSRGYLVVPVAIAEDAPSSVAWQRSEELGEGRATMTVPLALVGFVTRLAFNLVWREHGWRTPLDVEDPVGAIVALGLQAFVLATCALEGAIAAALHRRLNTFNSVDAPAVAEVFE